MNDTIDNSHVSETSNPTDKKAWITPTIEIITPIKRTAGGASTRPDYRESRGYSNGTLS